jgi:hypothetical protein
MPAVFSEALRLAPKVRLMGVTILKRYRTPQALSAGD